MSDKLYTLIGGPYDGHELWVPTNQNKIEFTQPEHRGDGSMGIVKHPYHFDADIPGIMIHGELSKADVMRRLVKTYIASLKPRMIIEDADQS